MENERIRHRAQGGKVYEGWNIGAVSVKRVRLGEDGTVQAGKGKALAWGLA